MEWLRCNKCYRLMGKSARTFIMTQCSHVFCDQCLTSVTTVCPECGKIEFATMKLTNPPKLETMINYFSPLTDFMTISQKKIQFHEEQLAICLRGSAEAEKKYENMKILFSKLTEDMKIMSMKYKKLHEESRQLDLAMQMESQSIEKPCNNAPRVIMASSMRQKNRQRLDLMQKVQHQSSKSQTQTVRFVEMPINPGCSENQRCKIEQPTKSGYQKISPASISNYPYNPRPPFSKSGYYSSGSLDSGRASMPVTPGSGQDLFRVPDISKVPKSVISLQKRKLTMLRIGNENSENGL